MKNNKKIPKFVFNLSPRQIKIFLDSYWLGDGWSHKGTKYYIFGEKLLADQIQELILKIGGNAVIRERNPLLINRKNKAIIENKEIISKKIYWTITENKTKYSSIFKKKIQEINYNDNAYCVTVKNSIIYVRRNGKPMWCGNSGQTYSLHGGTGSHVDFRAKNPAGQYFDPMQVVNAYQRLYPSV
jgi:replicative DNA helicase Mcm